MYLYSISLVMIKSNINFIDDHCIFDFMMIQYISIVLFIRKCIDDKLRTFICPLIFDDKFQGPFLASGKKEKMSISICMREEEQAHSQVHRITILMQGNFCRLVQTFKNSCIFTFLSLFSLLFPTFLTNMHLQILFTYMRALNVCYDL